MNNDLIERTIEDLDQLSTYEDGTFTPSAKRELKKLCLAIRDATLSEAEECVPPEKNSNPFDVAVVSKESYWHSIGWRGGHNAFRTAILEKLKALKNL